MKKPILILGDLIFPEGSIWNNGLLYFSDIFSHEVVSLSLEGKRETVFSLQDDYPVGVGLLPNGKMLINSLFGTITLMASLVSMVVARAFISVTSPKSPPAST